MEKQRYWWKDAKIYELYIDKFAGDLQGLRHRLDYLEKLGVNCLHILPHYPSPMIDDGYDVMDYRGVRSELGSIDDFKYVLSAAHAKGIRVITDFVLNHTSDRHPWFVEARTSRHNPKRSYYLWSDTGKELGHATNAFPMIKPRNWISNTFTEDYYFATFYPEQPDLNWDEPLVFEEMLSIMEYWAQMGVDGFRLDAARHLIKREGTDSAGLPETHDVLKRIRAHLESSYPDVVLLAEASTDTEKYFGIGDECHMAYNFALTQEMWMALMLGDQTRLRKVIHDMPSIPENCAWATFLGNHDAISLDTLDSADRSALIKKLDPKKRYLFGEFPALRIASIYDGDRDKILAAFKMLYSVPGAPVMYYGDEIGMRNLEPVPDIQDARRYVRGLFDWNEAQRQCEDPTSLFSATAALVRDKPDRTKPPVGTGNLF